MLKKFTYKLRSKKGETLVEALAGILIIALASLVLLTSTMSAQKINSTVKKADKEYKDAKTAAEEAVVSLDKSDGKPTIIVKNTDGTTIRTYTVELESTQ